MLKTQKENHGHEPTFEYGVALGCQRRSSQLYRAQSRTTYLRNSISSSAGASADPLMGRLVRVAKDARMVNKWRWPLVGIAVELHENPLDVVEVALQRVQESPCLKVLQGGTTAMK
ncbi:hypothetical protein C8R46DRAFT_1030692 [Mycena filopes]|nr:hypothetical protein C8R46DRAFT_1030692 [Mycena filopes]